MYMEMKILTETQRVPNGVAHAPRGRNDVQQRGIVARRFPLHQHHDQTRMERESDHWKTQTACRIICTRVMYVAYSAAYLEPRVREKGF